jgi:excinuclease ABC subunit A
MVKNPSTDSSDVLKLRGARENNLKNINLELPHNNLIGLTGLSGSGKSTLAFDILYAEGQRRYLETFSPYVRQFLEKFKAPNIELIQNLKPTIAIQQRTRIVQSRSTVGTLTGINDYLRVLWSNLSTPFCSTCKQELKFWTPKDVALDISSVLGRKTQSLFALASPYLLADDSEEELSKILSLGYTRFVDLATNSIIDETELSLAPSGGAILCLLGRVNHATSSTEILEQDVAQAFSFGEKKCILIELSNQQGIIKEYSSLQSCACGPREYKKASPNILIIQLVHVKNVKALDIF